MKVADPQNTVLDSAGGSIMNSEPTELEQEPPLQAGCEAQLEQLKQIIAEKVQDYERVDNELSSFCYSVSHDLRAPLRSLHGFSQALLDDYNEQLDDVAKQYLQRIRKASQTMHTLIDNLLTLSRISQFEISKQEFDLSEMVGKINENIKKQYSEEKHEVEIEHNLKVVADKNLFSIVIENLLSNAWKFKTTDEPLKMKFGKLPDSETDTFYIRDNGIGLSEIQSKKVFTPFYKIHPEDEYKGAGIGLATVQRIINRHNGKVWIESEPGKGTTVYFICAHT